MVHWLSSSIFPCSSVRPCRLWWHPTKSPLFSICRHKSIVLTQFYLIPIGTKFFWPSTKLDWPSTTKYQPVQPHTDPAPPFTDPILSCINQFRFFFPRSTVTLSFVDLRWAQLYVSLVVTCKHCKCCPGHSIIVNHSMSRFKFRNFFFIRNSQFASGLQSGRSGRKRSPGWGDALSRER